jgi:hypothetical protein
MSRHPYAESVVEEALLEWLGSLVLENRRFHHLLVNGVEVEVPRPGGGVRGVRVDLVDFENPAATTGSP